MIIIFLCGSLCLLSEALCYRYKKVTQSGFWDSLFFIICANILFNAHFFQQESGVSEFLRYKEDIPHIHGNAAL